MSEPKPFRYTNQIMKSVTKFQPKSITQKGPNLSSKTRKKPPKALLQGAILTYSFS
jgi:hypothetical protein